jgi:hypothetical protein
VLVVVCALPAIRLARADQGVPVLLLRRVPADALLTEAILRIKSELVAGGFQVAVTDSEGAEPDPRALMVRAARTLAPSATIGVFGDLQTGSAELWVVDRITSKTVIRRLEVQASSDRPISEVLAIRAQELLRASLVEVLVEENRPAPPVAPPPPEIQRKAKQVVASRLAASTLAPWTLGLELGGSAFGGSGGIGPTLAPAARLRLATGDHFWVRLTGLGLGTRPRVGTDARSASVAQNLLLLEFATCLRPRQVVRPLFSLGLGGERVAVDGSASMPYQGEHNARWFGAGDVGAGIALRLQTHLEVQLELHALFAAPRPAIRFFDVEAARAGQPTWLAILTLAGGA